MTAGRSDWRAGRIARDRPPVKGKRLASWQREAYPRQCSLALTALDRRIMSQAQATAEKHVLPAKQAGGHDGYEAVECLHVQQPVPAD
jgi:hypothetical protein